jgi:hypothetical protein
MTMDKWQQRKLKNRAKKQGGQVKSHEPETIINYQNCTPRFDIRCDSHSHCLENFDINVKANFASTIHKLGQMTWQQIEISNRAGLGYETIPISQIKPDHPTITISNDEKVKVFRLSDVERMAGIRLNKDTFVVLWIAPKHDLY